MLTVHNTPGTTALASGTSTNAPRTLSWAAGGTPEAACLMVASAAGTGHYGLTVYRQQIPPDVTAVQDLASSPITSAIRGQEIELNEGPCAAP